MSHIKTTRQILSNYKSGFIKSKRIRFKGPRKQDVYNITAPFRIKRTKHILGRVEPRELEDTTITQFFKKKKNSDTWVPEDGLPSFHLQDPAIKLINGQYVLSGVEVENRPRKEGLSYRTVFYKGRDLNNLRKFAQGPWGMKGIRLIELPDKKIGVFTRPQGKKGGRGKIGFTIVDSLSQLSPRVFSRAPLISKHFAKGEWGGVNDAVVLNNGKIGVLGHVARFSKDKTLRFYYPIAFCFDPKTREFSTFRLLVRRAELPEGEAKRPDLYNVVYPGGIVRQKDHTAKLYVGVGDAEAYEVTIKDPFEYYEENF